MPASPPSDAIDWTSYGFAFGQRLRHLRKAVGFTQELLGQRAGISRNQIQNWERNRNNDGGPANPTMRALHQLAEALGVPVFLLLPDGGHVPRRHRTDITPETPGIVVEIEPWLHAAQQAIAADPH